MERTWQFEFRGDDTCQGCSADALKQKSKISLLAEVFENVHGGERRRDLFFHIVQAYHTLAQETMPVSLYPSFRCAGEES